MRRLLLLLACAVACAQAYVLLPHVTECRPFAFSSPGRVAFVASDPGSPTPFTIRTTDPAALIASTGDQTGTISDINPSPLERGNMGDWAAGTHIVPPNDACLAATDASAAIIDAMPCDFNLQDVAVAYDPADYFPVQYNITRPGVYCGDPVMGVSYGSGRILVNVSSSQQVFIKAYISAGPATSCDSSADQHFQLDLLGGATPDNVIFRARVVPTGDPYAVPQPEAKLWSCYFAPWRSSFNATLISSNMFNLAGEYDIGRMLVTREFVTVNATGLILYGPYTGRFTADTHAPLFAAGQTTDVITFPALNGTFLLRNLATSVAGDLSAAVSVDAAARSTPQMLAGRTLVSPVLTLTHTGAFTTATLAFNATGVVVPDGFRLSCFKFVSGAWAEQSIGTLAADGVFVECTTTSFSDWSLQLMAIPPSSTGGEVALSSSAAADASTGGAPSSSSTGADAGTLIISVTVHGWETTGEGIGLLLLVSVMFTLALLTLLVLCLQPQAPALPYHPLAPPRSIPAAGSGTASRQSRPTRSRSAQ